jgi:hypothetical protein
MLYKWFFYLFTLALVVAGGCVVGKSGDSPQWIRGSDSQFSSTQYLLGVGEGENASQAEERAYAAVAKIFHAKIKAQSLDQESFSVQGRPGEEISSRDLQLEHEIQITTEKVLENVRILERWENTRNGAFYALAGMDRLQVERGILDQLSTLDQLVQENVDQSRNSIENKARVSHMKRAVTLLQQRQGYNTDLRVIRESGQGIEPPFQLETLDRKFKKILGEELLIEVRVEGHHANSLKVVLVKGLAQEGFRVIGDPRISPHPSLTSPSPSSRNPDFIIQGEGFLKNLELPDPLFVYVRWCGEFRVLEEATQRVIGVVTETGREGHVTEGMAQARALDAMETAVASRVVSVLSEFLFGEIPEESSISSVSCHSDNQ